MGLETDDAECLSCGDTEQDTGDDGIFDTPYGSLCAACHMEHIKIDLRDTIASHTVLRERCERAEGLLSRVAEYIVDDNIYAQGDPLWAEVKQADEAAKQGAVRDE